MGAAAGHGTRRGPRILGVLVAGLFASGCYRYVPAPLATVRPSEEVRVHVTQAAATRLVKEFGTYTTELEGKVARERSDSISVAVVIGREYNGIALESGRQVLYLGPGEVVDIRRRQLSRKRTVLVSAGAAVALGALVATVVQLGDPNSTVVEQPPPPPPDGRIMRRGIP
jgi:hypothetical protein